VRAALNRDPARPGEGKRPGAGDPAAPGADALRLATHLPGDLAAAREAAAAAGAAPGGTGGGAAGALTRGGPRVQRKCACGGTCEHCREEEEKGLAVQRMSLGFSFSFGAGGGAPAAPEADAAAPGAVLVDDGAAAGGGQAPVSAWLDALEGRLRAACDAELAAVGRDTEGCPYLERWLAHYRGRPAAHVEQAARRYTSADAGTPAALADAVVERARAAAARWARTGEVPELPAGVGPGGFPLGIGASFGGGSAGFSFSLSLKAEEGARGAASAASAADPAAVRARLGPGGALDAGARTRLERGFGTSFAGVRVHTDTRAARLSRELGARAFTVGRDVAFGAGEYRPGTLAGDLLIAHELAHTVQQSGGGLSPAAGESRELEAEADAAAAGALGLVDARPWPVRRAGLSLQRCDGDKKPAAPTASPSPAAPAPAPPPPAPDKIFEEPAAATAAGAPAALQAYAAMSPGDRKKAFQHSYGTGKLKPVLDALGPAKASASFPAELRELLGWIAEADGKRDWVAQYLGGVERETALAESGKTLDEMAATQAAREKSRSTPPPGWGGNTPRWKGLVKSERKAWTDRANAAKKKMAAYAQAHHPELNVTEATFEWKPKEIDEISLGAIATEGSQAGKTVYIGFEFVVLVETDEAYAMSTIAHELLGHSAYDARGSNFQQELYDRARTVEPSLPKGEESYHYWPSEIYSLLREYPYWTKVSAADETKKLKLPGSTSPPQDLNYDPLDAVRGHLKVIRDRWDPTLVVPVVRGYLQRLRVDPLIAPVALQGFEKAVGDVFPAADAQKILK
jgi:hypothetical protein